jgi:hypothetical protein
MDEGFTKAPGSPERRKADRDYIEKAAADVEGAAVKNPRRYNVANERAFGVAHALGSGYFVEMREGGRSDPYDSIDDLLDDGWTVD